MLWTRVIAAVEREPLRQRSNLARTGLQHSHILRRSGDARHDIGNLIHLCLRHTALRRYRAADAHTVCDGRRIIGNGNGVDADANALQCVCKRLAGKALNFNIELLEVAE